MSAVDELESALEWPSQAAAARENLTETSEQLLMGGTPAERETLQRLDAEVQEAIRDRRPEVLRVKVEELQRLNQAAVIPRG